MDFREKRTYDIFPMRFYDSVRRIFIFLKSLSLRDRRGRQKRVMVNASRRFSINRNAIADILFQGLNDLHFPSLSVSQLEQSTRLYMEKRDNYRPPNTASRSILDWPIYIYVSRKNEEEEEETTHGAGEKKGFSRNYRAIRSAIAHKLRGNDGRDEK